MNRHLAAPLVLVLAACGNSTPEAPDAGHGDHEHGPESLVAPKEAIDLEPAPNIVRVALSASRHKLIVGETEIDGYAFNRQVPGPTIRARRGDTLIVEFFNELDMPTTIHWHGLDVPYAMDGITWQRDPVMPGRGFRYEFKLNQTGTFWYHPHMDSAHQVDRGLYGVIVVEEGGEPHVDADLVLVFDAFGEVAPLPDGGTGGGHGEGGGHSHGDVAHEWTVNGMVQPLIPIAPGSAVRARLLNASNTGYLALRAPGLRQIAADQGLLSNERRPEVLLLSPGDRAEIELLVGSDGFAITTDPYSANGGAGHGDPEVLAKVTVTPPVTTPVAAPEPRAWPFPPRTPSKDPSFTDVVYVLQGEGERWMINGETFPNITIEEVKRGAEPIVEVRNLSATEHPFHLHGNVFEVLSENGVPVADYTLEDTINVPIGRRVRLKVRADNPGDWMAHCHILSHAEGGMMTILRVAGAP